MGKIGRIHGDNTVTIPAKNENAISNIIVFLSQIAFDSGFLCSQKPETQIT